MTRVCFRLSGRFCPAPKFVRIQTLSSRLKCVVCALCFWLWPSAARADGLPAWPVRLNVSMPLGSTWGREKLNGLTWGFRGALLSYPAPGGRGLGVGGWADALLDGRTHSMYTLGLLSTVPLAHLDLVDFRAGAFVGTRSSGEGGDDEKRLAAGALLELALPAYLYDLRLGVRLDGTFDNQGSSARSLLFELDVAVLLGAIGYAAGGAR